MIRSIFSYVYLPSVCTLRVSVYSDPLLIFKLDCLLFGIELHEFFISLKKDVHLFIFRERGKEGEKEGEKHQSVVASHVPPTGDLAATQACALTGNRTSNTLVHRPVFNPLSYTSQGTGMNF